MAINTIEKSVLLPYRAADVYALVERIEDYPGFLPWCASSDVRRREDGTIEATLGINYLGLRQSFSTRNRHTPNQRIDMTLLDGPFTALDGEWVFEPLSESACKASFRLQYEMRSGLFGRALAPVFGKISADLVDAFVAEANKRYG